MPDSELPASDRLSRGAVFLIESLRDTYFSGQAMHVFKWLAPLLERRGPMARDIRPDLDTADTARALREELNAGSVGDELPVETLVADACRLADERGEHEVKERDLVAAALAYLPDHVTSTVSGLPAGAESASGYRSRASQPTPALDQYGRDLTREAAVGLLPPVLGRETEIEQVIETLCRRTKRNPALIGPAGVGKTAVVEGLAQRIVAGEVPELLAGSRLVALQPTSLVAGASVYGELEKRLSKILEEANQDGMLLFIDEVHSIIGAGGRAGSSDIASQLKPVLARGEIACIVATTDMEYTRDIKRDHALERRFNPVKINELSPEHTLEILRAMAGDERMTRGVKVADAVLDDLVRLSHRYLRNRHFPDKALDLFDQCVASALTHGRDTVEPAEAHALVRRLVGMPLDMREGIGRLREHLGAAGSLGENDQQRLIDRLRTSLRDLDLAPERPNVVMLLAGDAARLARDLGATIAGDLFADPERVVSVDLARFAHSADVNSISGSPAGYVGHGDPLPHDPLHQTPWCVVLWENVHACHPQVRALLGRILATGELQDARGQTTWFSDAVVIMTTGSIAAGGHAERPVGFEVSPEVVTDTALGRDDLVRLLGPELAAQVDLAITEVASSQASDASWLRSSLLDVVASRYAERGLEVQWDESFVRWLDGVELPARSLKDYETVLERNVNPKLLAFLVDGEEASRRRVTVRSVAGDIVVETETPREG
jgi:ATP-dependent Clp protease ATP-binding subunit ClpC